MLAYSKEITFYQAMRYGIVGILSNLIGYLIYLLATYWGLDPKMAITLLYPIGIIIAYFGHSKYSFSYQGKSTSAMIRYVFAHLIGYSVNLMMLFILVDKFNCPHQAVQAFAIIVVGGVLFLLFKFLVFLPDHTNAARGAL